MAFGVNTVLISYLYLSITGFLVSTLALVVLGHRTKLNHWLASLCLNAILTYGCAALLDLLFAITIPQHVLLFVFLFNVAVVALAENWNLFGQINFGFTAQGVLAFVAYAAYVTFTSKLGLLSLLFSTLLLILVICAMTLMLVHSFELADVITRKKWTRTATPKPSERYFPKVSLHVPAYNEPPDMVIATLDALAKLDYPNYEVLMIDDNTTDEALWRPLEAHCKKLGFKFFHLDNWPGYKSGALNFAATQTDPAAEIVGIIDSDYIVEPNYLKDLVGYFENPRMAFVQTPQDYRDFDPKDRYAKACYHAYQYFFKISMATRNERNGIIFTGTMGLIRKTVLEEVGGWDEWCITEDAEIALKILDRGYESLYIDKTYGRGLMPLNFEGLKKQRFRWAFGGMQVIRLHWKTLIPRLLNRHDGSQLSFGQKFDFWSGGLQWFNDPITFLFTVILLINALSYSLTQSVFLEPMAGAGLFVPFVFIITSLTRSLWGLRRRLECTFAEALCAMLVLLSLTWVVTLACVLGLTKKAGVFLRTPKQKGRRSLWRSFNIVSKEISIALICCTAIMSLAFTERPSATIWLLSGLLLWQAFIYGASVMVSRWSYISESRVINEDIRRTSRSTGTRFGSMVTDFRGVTAVVSIAAAIGIFFYASVTNAPEKEVVFRANPLERTLVPHELISNPPDVIANAKIFLEESAAIAKNMDTILKLWDVDGVIRDTQFTLNDPSDDRVWRGLDQIKARYQEEFKLRTYLALEHKIVSTIANESEVVIVNDLSATIISNGRKQKVFLSKGDRWTLRKINGQWKISELIVNRAMR